MSSTLDTISERRLQRAVLQLLSDPSRVWRGAKGERLQILAPGRLNVHEGPDFLDVAVLIGADVVVGNAEFHRRASDWIHHQHESDPSYSMLVLHIVLENDIRLPSDHATLVLSADELRLHLRSLPVQGLDTTADEVHSYALLRLLRMAHELRSLLAHRTVEQSYLRSVETFIMKYRRKRRRPVNAEPHVQSVLDAMSHSAQLRFLQDVYHGVPTPIVDGMYELCKQSIANESPQLRMEIIINCLLPTLVAVARDAARIDIFEWYWSAEAMTMYAVLDRHFHHVSQKYLWQQQGLLEIMRDQRLDPAAHEQRTSYGLLRTVERLATTLFTLEKS